MVAGYLAPNPQQNANIAGGVRFYFRRTGSSQFMDVGTVADVSSTPGNEQYEFNSTHGGRQSIAKTILLNRELTINLTLREINVENYRLGFYGGAEETGSINVIAAATPARTAAGTWVLPETDGTIAALVEVRSEDGETLYSVTTDYTSSAGSNTITPAASGNLESDSPNEGDKIHVLYRVTFAGATTRKVELMDTTTIEGAAQFHVRNQDGGLAQIMELDSVSIAPDGAIGYAVDDVQSIPLVITAQVSNGAIGRTYFKDI